MVDCLVTVAGRDETYTKAFADTPEPGDVFDLPNGLEVTVSEVVPGGAGDDQPSLIVRTSALFGH